MPRLARLDIAGVLQHVMVRGIEKRDIFIDDRDRTAFVDRFSRLLLKTSTDCLACSLLSNHLHLLLRRTRRGRWCIIYLIHYLPLGNRFSVGRTSREWLRGSNITIRYINYQRPLRTLLFR
jgi:hypothetical protein